MNRIQGECAMEWRPFDRIEQQILSTDTGSIHYRYKWGHLVIIEPELFSGGRLRKGATEKLIARAAAHGSRLSPREVRYRVELAKTYPYASQIRQLVAEFRGWKDVIQAGFPPVDAPSDEERYDPRTLAKKRHDTDREVNRLLDDPAMNGQEPLPGMRMFLPGFTPDTVGPETLLCEAFKMHNSICTEVAPYYRKMAAEAAAADQERGFKLEQLAKAVDHNMQASLGEAEVALFGE